MLVIDGKAFPCHRKANVFLYCVELKENSSLNRNKLVSTSLQDIIAKQKVSLFLLASLIGIREKYPAKYGDHDCMYIGRYFAFYYWTTLLQAYPPGDQVNKDKFQFECM